MICQQKQAAILSHLFSANNLLFAVDTCSFGILILLLLDSCEASSVQDKSKAYKICV